MTAIKNNDAISMISNCIIYNLVQQMIIYVVLDMGEYKHFKKLILKLPMLNYVKK